MELYQKVRLLTDAYIEDGIKKGDIGYIVLQHDDDHFEVDFSDENGFTIACFAFPKDELELAE